MAQKIEAILNKVTAEDIEFGDGQVTQTRKGVPTVLTKVNATHIPLKTATSTNKTTVEDSILDLDSRTVDIDNRVADIDDKLLRLSKFGTLTAALSSIGTAEKTLIIDRIEKLTTDVIIPENVTLMFLKGAYIDSDATVGTFTLSINGGIDAGLYRIFGDNLTVTGNPKIEAVYPEWFGAKGDGVTDDIIPIQRAVDFYSTVILQAKQYIVSDSIKLHSNSTLAGSGKYETLLYNNSTSAVPVIEIVGNYTSRIKSVKITNLGIRNGSARNDTYTIGKDGIKVEYADDLIIESCYIHEIEGAFGLRTKYSTNIKSINNHFYRCTYSCFTVLVECENILVEGNIFDTTTAQSTPQNYLFSTGGENLNEGQFFCKNVWVVNNIFKNNPRWEGIDTHGCENIWIENNYIENVRVGIMCSIASGYVANPLLKNVFIRNNVCIATENADHNGIVVSGSNSYILAENVYIENNEVIGFGAITTSAAGAITTYVTKNVHIRNNTIKNSYGIGISIYYAVYNCTIEGNDISDFLGVNGAGTTAGISLVSYGLYNVKIENNRIYQGNGINIDYGISVYSPYIYTKIGNNFIVANDRYRNYGYLPVYKSTTPNIPGMQGDSATNLDDKPTYWCSDLVLKCGGIMDWSAITVSGTAGNNYVDITAGDKRMIPIGAEIVITGAGDAGADLTTVVTDIDLSIDRIYLKDTLSTSVTDTTISSGTPNWA